MTRRLLLGLLALALHHPVHAQQGTITIFKPATAKPASNVFVTVRTRFVKVIWLYVDGQYGGRRDLAGASSGANLDTILSMRFPQITTQDGQWEIKVVGTDIDGKQITATSRVSPTIHRDVRVKLEPSAPVIVRAPLAARFKPPPTLTSVPDTKFKVEISPTSGLVLPGSQTPFTTKAYDETGALIPNFQPPLRVTGGAVKKGNVWIAPRAHGRYRISTQLGGAVAQAFIDVGKPVKIQVRSWGVHQIRISGHTFIKTLYRVDPNIRPTIDIVMLLQPADKGKELTITVEGLNDGGAVLISRELAISVFAPK